jgi:amino acid transporter
VEEATHLKRNQFGTKSAIIFALVYTAPVMSLAGALQVMAGKVGYGVPMGMMVGALAMIATALSLMEMVKTKPHTAGSIGAFGKEALGPVWGFVPGWMILVINLNIIFPAPICAVYLHSTLEGFFGWSPPAWVMVIGIVSVAAYIAWRGIVPSLEAALVFFCVEMVIMGALAVTGFILAGQHGVLAHRLVLNLTPAASFPAGYKALGAVGLWAAASYSVYLYAGYEAVTTLGEEAKAARKAITTAVVVSVVVVAFVFAIFSAGLIDGPIKSFSAFTGSLDGLAAVATDYWGNHGIGPVHFATFVSLAAFTSAFACTLLIVNESSRISYYFGKEGHLPAYRWFGKVHPKHHSPSNAILFSWILGLIVAVPGTLAGAGETLPLVHWSLPVNTWVTWFSVETTLFVVMYIFINALNLIHYRNKWTPYGIVMNKIVPIVGGGLMCYFWTQQVHATWWWSIGVVAAGVVVVLLMSWRRPQAFKGEHMEKGIPLLDWERGVREPLPENPE